MSRSMNTLRPYAVLLALLCLIPAPAQSMTLDDAINVAGRQRMLSQRMVKAYCQIALRVLPADARAELDASADRFERQLGQLRQFAKAPLLSDAIDEVTRAWARQKSTLAREPDLDLARRAQYQGEMLLETSHLVVLILQDEAAHPVGKLVNISGRQRMLSQRLAKLYMLRILGVDTISVRDELRRARNEFERVHGILSHSSLNTPEINAELEEVDTQWEWFRAVLEETDGRPFSLIVSEASEKVLSSMERITGHYARLRRDGTQSRKLSEATKVY